VANDYKTDQGKPPLLDALLPFYPALARLALMMQDAAEVHRLQGAVDPFNQWRQLPDAKRRLANAGARHLLKGPWVHDDVLKDHPHAALALFNILASLTLHEEEQAGPEIPTAADYATDMELDNLRRVCLELYMAGRWTATGLDSTDQARMWSGLRDALGLPAGTATQAGVASPGREAVLARELAAHRASLFPQDADLCCGAPDAQPRADALQERARVELWLQGERTASPEVCRHLCGITAGHCVDCGREVLGQTSREIHGPAGADWREHHQVAPRCQTMAGLGADQCLLAAGHPGAHHYATDDYS
jgi:hypothetical protein